MKQLFEHSGPWTIEDVEALPDNGFHDKYEILMPGALTVSPVPGTRHQRASANLANLLATVVPADLEVLNLNVEIPGGRLCQPDIVVMDTAFADTGPIRLPPRVVALVVEVVASNSHPQDRIIKPQLYADAKIPAYWRLEIEGTPRLIASVLRRGRYARVVTAVAGGGTVIDQPFRLEVDPADLVRRVGG